MKYIIIITLLLAPLAYGQQPVALQKKQNISIRGMALPSACPPQLEERRKVAQPPQQNQSTPQSHPKSRSAKRNWLEPVTAMNEENDNPVHPVHPCKYPPQHPAPRFQPPTTCPTLPEHLVQEKQYRSAAIEYRRLALTSIEDDQKAGYYWGAAYIYHLNHDDTLAIKMLDFSEDASSLFEQETTLLRLDCAIAQKNTSEAGFYAESLAQSSTNKLKHIAQSRRAKLAIMNHNNKKWSRDAPVPKLAQSLLSTTTSKETMTAIKTYSASRDKSPRLGGFLGMIPGLGYAYSGEYANALRSLIMNSLFIYAMVDTAEDDNWGIFSVITFFEITWYTGSIYGGVDSAHRHNRNRLQACLQVIDDQSQYKPDLRKMPAITLKYSF